MTGATPAWPKGSGRRSPKPRSDRWCRPPCRRARRRSSIVLYLPLKGGGRSPSKSAVTRVFDARRERVGELPFFQFGKVDRHPDPPPFRGKEKKPSHLLERAGEIVEQIVDMLEAHRQPHQPVADAEL